MFLCSWLYSDPSSVHWLFACPFPLQFLSHLFYSSGPLPAHSGKAFCLLTIQVFKVADLKLPVDCPHSNIPCSNLYLIFTWIVNAIRKWQIEANIKIFFPYIVYLRQYYSSLMLNLWTLMNLCIVNICEIICI